MPTVALTVSVVLAAVTLAVVPAGAMPRAAANDITKAHSSSPGRAQRIATEQSGAVDAGRALGLASGEKLAVKDVITDADGSTHVRYDRTFDGLRVIGGDFVSHRDRSGRIEGVSWNGPHQVAVASMTPRVTLASAKTTGTRKAASAQERTSATQGELVLYATAGPSKAPAKLAYDVLTVGVRADQTPSRLHTIVDARTGGTLATWDEVKSEGTGTGIHVGNVSIGTTAGPPWSMSDTTGNYTTDLFGSSSDTAAGTTFTDADNVWGDGTVSDPASAGVDAQYGAEKTFDYFKNVLGRNGIWGTGAGARSRVHYGASYQNAFWDGSQMTYGDGAGNTHPLVSLDVAGHEMTHGVTENTAGLAGSGEAGGLNEATSDIFGTSVEWYAGNAVDNPDYLIGELIDFNGDGTPLRYMDRPSRDGASVDCWSPAVGGLDPHLAAGPLNHVFYLASEGSGPKVVNGVSYNSPTCNASTVAPVGREKAARIWYRALTTYLTSGSGYAAAREGAIQSAKDLYGATSPECTNIAAAFSAIAVPAGAATCTAPPPPSPGSALPHNPGFELGDSFWSATPNIIGQWGADQPARSGTWSAWLAGYGSEHTDSVSQLVTIPASTSATLSYYVHINTSETTASQVHDTMTVRAGSTVLQTLSNLDAADGYQLRTVNLSAYVGQTVALSFTGAENFSAATSFVLDDTSITTPPGAPLIDTATAGNASGVARWTAPSSGGSAITGYTVRVVNAATSVQVGALRPAPATASSLTVSGLTNGTAYKWQVRATNVRGSSAFSAMSNAVTPAVTAALTRLSDFNHDGLTDLVARSSDGVLWLYPGNGAGRFLSPVRIGPGGWNPMSIVTPGDVNGDGNADILARDSAGALWFYPGNGASGLRAGRRIGLGWGSFTLAAAANLNGAGRPDLLARDSAGVLWLYPLSGDAAFGTRVRIGAGWGSMTSILGPGDVTGDGLADILARDGAGVLHLYPGNGAGRVTAGSVVTGGWSAMTALVTPGNWDRAVGNDVLTRDAAGALWLHPGGNDRGFGPPLRIGSGWAAMTYVG